VLMRPQGIGGARDCHPAGGALRARADAQGGCPPLPVPRPSTYKVPV
jgi:hypothetical protein